MNSEKKKPGPHGVHLGDLISWEHEWYWVFAGMAFGVPSRTSAQTALEPVQGPKLLVWRPESKRPRGYERLDRERLQQWNSEPESKKWRTVEYSDLIPGIPPEPEVWLQIKEAESPADIRAAFDRSPIWLNPKRHGRPYVNELRDHAAEFLKAKEYRYPGSNRPSSEMKRVIHFSRAMAGIMTEDIGAVRAIDLFRLLEHGERCQCTLCSIERNEKLEKAIRALLASG
ncbi:MAG: hypothetical protein ACRD4R_02760 [Candidatus Acidiferrales bacterium]